MKNERVMIFIDYSNVFKSADRFKKGLRIDLNKLRKELSGNRILMRTYFYGAESLDPEILKHQKKFHYNLRRMGFHITTKPLRLRDGRKPVEKGVDTCLVSDILWLAFVDAYDTAIIVSGDEDFRDVVDKVKLLGKKIEIASFTNSITLRFKFTADKFMNLDSMVDKIEKKTYRNS